MYKLITYLIYIGVFVGAAIWFKNNDGILTIDWFDKVIEIQMSFLIVCCAIALIAGIYLFKIIRFIFWAPSRRKQKNEIARRDNGHDSIMKGFSSLAAGDTKSAKKFAKTASKQLKDISIVNLLNAQIGVASGDNKLAEHNYKLLSENKNSEFLGKRGLIASAVKDKDNIKALELTEDLISNNNKNQWSISTALNLSLKEQSWSKAERYIKNSKKVTSERRKELLAFIHFARAFNNNYGVTTVDSKLVEYQLLQCLKNCPKASPALIMLAEIYTNDNNKSKAKKLIEKHWSKAALNQVVNIYYNLYEGMNINKKIKSLTKFANKNTDNPYSFVVLAKAYIENEQYDKANIELQKASALKETSSICLLLAEIDEKNEEIDRSFWRDRATNSCPDNVIIDKAYYKAWIDENSDAGLNADINWNLYFNSDSDMQMASDLDNALLVNKTNNNALQNEEYLLIKE